MDVEDLIKDINTKTQDVTIGQNQLLIQLFSNSALTRPTLQFNFFRGIPDMYIYIDHFL